jgi:nucleotide-binding universal stress UspA family protein
VFKKILHANDGSEPAFHAFALAMALAEQNKAELHMVCVEELPNLPDFIEDVRQTTETAERRFRDVLQRARKAVEERHLQVHTHVLVGHAARDVVNLAENIGADLLVIGATGHSAIYERLIGSRADRIVQLARCPVLVAK